MTTRRFRIALAAPHPSTPADDAWGLLVSPWLGDSVLDQGWEGGDAADLDYILVPYTYGATSASPFASREALRRFLALLPGFGAAPERHVLLDNTDLDTPAEEVGGAVLFKTSANVRHSSVLPLPYSLPDPGPPSPVGDAELDLAFQGSLDTHPIRDWMNKWRHSWHGLEVELVPTPRPFWLLDPAERVVLARSYVQQLRRTRFVLCPRGRAVNSRRFFEALAHGRVPVLITDAARLPLEGRIDYSRFVVIVPEGFGRWVPEYVADFLRRHDLSEACRLARETWQEWFAAARFRHFVEASLADSGSVPR